MKGILHGCMESLAQLHCLAPTDLFGSAAHDCAGEFGRHWSKERDCLFVVNQLALSLGHLPPGGIDVLSELNQALDHACFLSVCGSHSPDDGVHENAHEIPILDGAIPLRRVFAHVQLGADWAKVLVCLQSCFPVFCALAASADDARAHSVADCSQAGQEVIYPGLKCYRHPQLLEETDLAHNAGIEGAVCCGFAKLCAHISRFAYQFLL